MTWDQDLPAMVFQVEDRRWQHFVDGALNSSRDWTGSSVVEHFPSPCETLGSIPAWRSQGEEGSLF